jgi:hypothetical protein
MSFINAHNFQLASTSSLIFRAGSTLSFVGFLLYLLSYIGLFTRKVNATQVVADRTQKIIRLIRRSAYVFFFIATSFFLCGLYQTSNL